MTRLMAVLLLVTTAPLFLPQIVRPPLKPGEISDELMAEAIEEGLAGHGDFGSAACIATRAGGVASASQWRVVLRGPAGRIADTAARAVATHQGSGIIPASMMAAPEISVEISIVPGGASAAATAPTQMALVSAPTDGRARSEAALATLQWSAVDSAGGRIASASLRRADLPSAFEVVLRGAEGAGAAWSCSLRRDDVARIQ